MGHNTHSRHKGEIPNTGLKNKMNNEFRLFCPGRTSVWKWTCGKQNKTGNVVNKLKDYDIV